MDPASSSDLQILAFFFLVCPLFYWIYWRFQHRRLLELAARIPGPPGLPLLGNTFSFIGEPHHIFNNVMHYSHEYHDVIKMWLGPRLFVFLTNPADIEILMTSQHIEKAQEYDFMKPWMGNGLLISSGGKWYAHRKVIAQTFHVQILRTFMNRFNEYSKRLVKRLSKEAGTEFDVRGHLAKFTADTLLSTVMGAGDLYDTVDYSRCTTRMCTLVHARQTKPYLRPGFIYNMTKYGIEQKKVLSVIHDFSEKVIKWKRTAGSKKNVISEEANDTEKSNILENKIASETGISFAQSSGLKDDLDAQLEEKKKGVFLDTILEKASRNEIFTFDEVKEQFDTVMFEGHDTTASLTSMFLCLMAVYPDIQEKVADELYSIFGDSDRDITFDDLLEMKYLERCMMETMRLHSPVPIIARKLKSELKLATNGIVLPEHCTIIIGIYKLHRRPDIYPDPDRFNPDNFLPENTMRRSYYAFIPFSAGVRSCVGRKYAVLKAKTVLATILRNYKVTTTCPEDKWMLQADITLKRTDGSKIILTPRNWNET